MSDPNQEEVKSMTILSLRTIIQRKSFFQGYIKEEGYFINKRISLLSNESQNHKKEKFVKVKLHPTLAVFISLQYDNFFDRNSRIPNSMILTIFLDPTEKTGSSRWI